LWRSLDPFEVFLVLTYKLQNKQKENGKKTITITIKKINKKMMEKKLLQLL
jgi:hypothetical protein